jgi:tRNA (guanine-N7-)-methyltransferase
MQRVIPIQSPNFITQDSLKSPPEWPEIFGNDHPLALEIGCGTGHFILEQARRHPHQNFLAIDIYNKGCFKTCRKLDLAGIKNVRIMRIEARWLLANALQPESLAAVYINCPDPWPKKRHRKRRLVNHGFLTTLAHYMLPGAEIFFSTDYIDYAQDVSNELGLHVAFQNALAADWVHHIQGYPSSKYMQRFIEKGQLIYYLHYRRDPKINRRALDRPEETPGFRLSWHATEHG